MRMELAAPSVTDQPPSLGKLAPASSAVAGDFWDVANPGMVGAQQLPADHGFSDVIAVQRGGFEIGKAMIYGGLSLALAIAGYFAYQMFIHEKDPLTHAEELYKEGLELLGLAEAPVVEPVIVKKPKAPKLRPLVSTAKETKKPSRQVVAGNPYWTLPNKLLGPVTEVHRQWTVEEEETWRAGLAHKYTYQRYKTVQEVRERHLKGSEAILWDALQDRKFWTRGFAALGLAEFNVEISLQTLETALAKERSELVADFFERFIKKPSAAEAFVLRQAIRLLDEKGRLIAIQGIANSKDELRELYLAAATQDPGRQIQRWITRYLETRPMDPDRYNDLLTVVTGEADGTYLLSATDPKPAKTKKPTPPLKLATDEDLDKELAAFEQAGGDVEIYDEDAAPVSRRDPDEYEYQDAQGTKPRPEIKKSAPAPLPKSGKDGV